MPAERVDYYSDEEFEQAQQQEAECFGEQDQEPEIVPCGACGSPTYDTNEDPQKNLCGDCDRDQRIIKSMSWMITQLKWQMDNQRDELDDVGSQGGYSSELTEAIELLKELRNG